MTAAFAVQDTAPHWSVVIAALTLGLLTLAVIARRESVRDQQADRELKALQMRKQMAANARAATLCAVRFPVACTDTGTTEIAGVKMCDRHAAPFLAHATSRDELLDLEAHWEADSHHGLHHIEALANGLIDP